MANKKSRPAKDIKPTDLRAKALQEAKTNKTKALASEMKKKASAQAASKKVGPAKDLKGGARAKFLKDVKSGKIQAKPPKIINKGLPTAAASRLMKLGSTAALAVTFYLGDTFSTKTGGAAQAPAPKKGEKLMRGVPQVGYGSKTSSAAYGYKAKNIPTKKDIVGNNPNRGLGTSKPKSSASLEEDKYFGGINPDIILGKSSGGVYKPDTAKDKMKRQLQGRKPDKVPAAAQVAPKAAASVAAKRQAFKGNWTGAAATEMQKRGGAKIKRPNLLSLFRKKK